ncbi:MAG TPA: hypothetical protein VFM05_05580, partial [Candidatus Saccharimonadales bacterium]|nr:hypothetical protein [Candidatus Saccharimonadales bacterium]
GEDAGVTVDYLAQRCMPGEVRFGFECITKRSGEDLEVYRERIIQSPLAVVAKWGDSAANLANTLLRQPYVPEDIFSDRVDNYLGNLVFLKPYMPQPDQLVMPSVWVPPAISAG